MPGSHVRLTVISLAAVLWGFGRVGAQEAEPSPPAQGPSPAVRAVQAEPEIPAQPDVPAQPDAPTEDDAQAEVSEERLITMDFQDVDLGVLVKFISEITGRNFIVDDRVKGKITIISPDRISVEEAYAVFQSVLQVKGFTTVPSGPIIKIIPAQEAKSSTVETVLPGGAAMLGDEFITKLIPLENVQVNNMLPIIQPLVSSNGLLAAYAATNMLIIIDSAANIARISRILHELDVAGLERGMEVIRLHYAFAAEIAATLAQVLEEPQGRGAVTTAAPTAARAAATRRRATSAAARPPRAPSQATVAQGGMGERIYRIIPDERTNSLVMVAGPLEMRRIKDLIVRLDVPLPFGAGRIHVYYLKYANAFEIVPVLADLIGGSGPGFAGLGGGLTARRIGGTTAARGGRLGQRGGVGGIGQGLGRGGGGFGGGGLGGQRGFGGPTGTLGGGRGGGGVGGGGVSSITGGGTGEFEGEVRITADPSTNALIINASPRDFETLKQVIVQLDVRRRQVYVEAIIMEVRIDLDRDLGIELQGAVDLGAGVGLGRTNFGSINSVIANPASLGGLLLAAASKQTIRLPDGTVVPAQQALISASEGTTDINILSAPNILTTDNQEAEIVVGQNIPFISSRSTSETNLSNQFATIERRDVGITLRITPQISEGGMIRLDIFEEVSAVVPPPPQSGIDVNQLGPTTTIRSATTTVVVRDEQTVVIGGLISDDDTHAENRVPFWSDIPVLGNLLKRTRDMRRKINLLIFLTPRIIRDSHDHRDESLEQRGKLKAFMDEHRFDNRRPEFLDRPSWIPELPKLEHDAEDEAENNSTDSSSNGRPLNDLRAGAARSNGRDLDSPPPVRYVLLASFAERGTPPLGLASKSGLLAVNLPVDSKLTALFEKGGRYRYSNDTFEGLYQCLEAYQTMREALLVYPEGLPVDQETGELLHWRQWNDASSTNIAAWTPVQ